MSIVVLLMLVSIASANSSRIAIGPYNITFDLNTPKNYTVEVMPPLENNNSTAYVALINVSNETKAGIYISELKTPEDATLKTIKQIYQAYTHDLQHASVEMGKIDGKEGLIAYAVDHQNRQTFWDVYWLDSKKCDCGPLFAGSEEVRLIGSMPRNSTDGMAIVKSLINTIHIEKAVMPGAEAAKMVVPKVRPTPYILVRNQNVEDTGGAVQIEEAVSDGPGWAVIYNDKYVPYSNQPIHNAIGYTHLNDGLNRNVKVKLNMALVTPKLYAVLHKDEGIVGTFEYPGLDYPLDPREEVIYPFYSIWPYPKEDFPRVSGMSGPGPDWLGSYWQA